MSSLDPWVFFYDDNNNADNDVVVGYSSVRLSVWFGLISA